MARARAAAARSPAGLVPATAGRPWRYLGHRLDQRARAPLLACVKWGVIAFSSHRSMRPSIAATPTGPIAAGAVEGARLAQDLGRVEAHALAPVVGRQPLELGQQRARVAAAARPRGDEHALDLGHAGRERAQAAARDGALALVEHEPRGAVAAEVVLGGEDLLGGHEGVAQALAHELEVLGEERLRRRAGRRLVGGSSAAGAGRG